jgi:hypothetical protein
MGIRLCRIGDFLQGRTIAYKYFEEFTMTAWNVHLKKRQCAAGVSDWGYGQNCGYGQKNADCAGLGIS